VGEVKLKKMAGPLKRSRGNTTFDGIGYYYPTPTKKKNAKKDTKRPTRQKKTVRKASYEDPNLHVSKTSVFLGKTVMKPPKNLDGWCNYTIQRTNIVTSVYGKQKPELVGGCLMSPYQFYSTAVTAAPEYYKYTDTLFRLCPDDTLDGNASSHIQSVNATTGDIGTAVAAAAQSTDRTMWVGKYSANMMFTSESVLNMDAVIYWVTPRMDTKREPVSEWEQCILDDGNQYQASIDTAAINLLSTTSRYYQVGYPTTTTIGYKPESNKSWSKRWKVLAKRHHTFSPGGNLKCYVQYNFGSTVSETEMARATYDEGFFLKNKSVLCFVIIKGYPTLAIKQTGTDPDVFADSNFPTISSAKVLVTSEEKVRFAMRKDVSSRLTRYAASYVNTLVAQFENVNPEKDEVMDNTTTTG